MSEFKESLMNKLNSCNQQLEPQELQDMRVIYQTDKKSWIRLVNHTISRVKKKEDFSFFFWLLEQFQTEITEVAPFVAAQLNRVFLLLVKWNYFHQLAAQTSLLEYCANFRLLEEINRLISEKVFDKFLSTMEIYKLKRLVYQLTQKFEKSDIAFQLRIDLENPDLEWKETIDKS